MHARVIGLSGKDLLSVEDLATGRRAKVRIEGAEGRKEGEELHLDVMGWQMARGGRSEALIVEVPKEERARRAARERGEADEEGTLSEEDAEALAEDAELVIEAEEDTPHFIEEREAEPSDLKAPKFIAGLVRRDADGLYIEIDRKAGYPPGMLRAGVVPERLPAEASLKEGQLVGIRREGKTGSHSWSVEEVCGKLGDARAEVRALGYRSNSSPEFGDEAKGQAAQLQRRYEEAQARAKAETGEEDRRDRAFMEREALVHLENGRERMSGRLVLEKEDYVHGETRLDLRDRDDIDIFTIDPEKAKDFDDAISFREVVRDGRTLYEVGVHIADVSHFVRQGSELEKAARFRQFTRYLKSEVIPMLPPVIADKLASLEPGKDRLAYSTIFTFEEDGTERADERWFGRAIINSKKRFSYDEADAALADEGDARHGTLGVLKGFADRMRAARAARGAVSFGERPEADVEFGKDGSETRITPKRRATTSYLIEDFMLAANEAQGAYLREKMGPGAPLPLRAHDAPPPRDLARAIGRLLSVDKRHPDNRELRAILLEYERIMSGEGADAVKERAFLESGSVSRALNLFHKRVGETKNAKAGAMAAQSLRSLLKRARYTIDPEWHFTLAVEPYLHATSPIRRYPDILVQYLMNEAQRGRTGASISNDASIAYLKDAVEHANVALALSRKAEQDVLQLAYLDKLEKKLASAGKEGVRFSGTNAVVRDADPRRGLQVALKLESGTEYLAWIPWEDAGAHKDEDGRYMVRVPKGKGTEERLARAHLGPTAEGVRTLEVKVVSVDRWRREARFKVLRRKTLDLPDRPRKRGKRPI